MKKIKCTKKAKRLLKESILNWECWHTELVLSLGKRFVTDHSGSDCPLCDWYGDRDCEGCPIGEDSGGDCNGTPYYKWRNSRSAITSQECVNLHLAMITYMKGLYKRCVVV